MNKTKFVSSVIIGLALYLVATGLSFAGFSYFVKKPVAEVQTPAGSSGPQSHFTIDPNAPKTAACPINGAYFTQQEKDIWSKRRPLAVMIENHQDARPQSGLSSADVVYEAVAEGGITRFMGIFYCGAAAKSVNLAPVRSARTYFLPWVLEYDALYNHVGGAGNCDDPTVDERAKALCQIQQWKIKNMDQFGISFPTCYRNYDRLDHPVATEHTMVCVSDKLYSLAAERGWTNVDASGISWDAHFTGWKFKDDAALSDRPASFSASFVAWPGYESGYGVQWVYDRATNTYKRYNGGQPQTDLETKQQLTAKDVVILFAKETGPVDGHGHLLYADVGSGDAVVFEDGKTVQGTWKKPDRNARTLFYDGTGREVSFNRGQIWIEMLPTGTKIHY
ncbi:DUF3048 domain-containing protein [Patescibacteria group bacterium]|nr:DUF3048 domain-containing protein [Patescibacteria group bacterium]